jgi:hypothetical protein
MGPGEFVVVPRGVDHRTIAGGNQIPSRPLKWALKSPFHLRRERPS